MDHPKGATVHGSLEDWYGRGRAVAGRGVRAATTSASGLAAAARDVRPRTWAIIGVSVIALMLIAWQRCGVSGCPSVDTLAAFQPEGAPVLLDSDGEPFAVLMPVQRELIPLESLPEHVGQAFIAVEDQRFYEHGGIDIRRVGGSAVAVARAGSYVQGSSTITMQLARNAFPDRLPATKTMGRKVVEARVARAIEKRFTKDEILELYLNHIYFGAGVYGIAAASRHYFGRPASQLSLSQAALLAALPKAPTHYEPRRNPEAARTRRDLVLSLMAQQGRITDAEAAAAKKNGLGTTATPPAARREASVAPWFTDAVRRQLEADLGDGLYSGGLRVHTTLDRRVQAAAEQALERQLTTVERGTYGRFAGARYVAGAASPEGGPTYLQGAIVVLDAADGRVLALVGGRDFRQSGFNRAVDARRQVGSTFKPFVFAAALDRGYAPSQHVADTPLRLELAGGEVWEPKNLTGGFEGEVTLRDALVRSKNVPAVRLAGTVGERDVARLARRAGVRSAIPELPSMALGTAEMSPLELTAAYTMFPGGGMAVEPRLVTHVEDGDGRTVWASKPRRSRVTDPGTAFLINDMLAEAVDRGTGTSVRSAGFRGTAAGKTGTTDGGTDAWFVGYTPDLVAGIWIGFDRPAAIAGEATAGRIAAPAWGHLMQQVQRHRPSSAEWQVPDRVVSLSIDPATGLVLADGCRPSRGEPQQEYFVRGTEPARVCPDGAERGRGPGVLARLVARSRNAWHQTRGWVLAQLGRDEPEADRVARERLLGTQRLPRATEIREPELDTARYRLVPGVPIGVPVDVTRQADTLTVPPDTLPADTLPPPNVPPPTTPPNVPPPNVPPPTTPPPTTPPTTPPPTTPPPTTPPPTTPPDTLPPPMPQR
jgi:penicillin-binding protein 1A